MSHLSVTKRYKMTITVPLYYDLLSRIIQFLVTQALSIPLSIQCIFALMSQFEYWKCELPRKFQMAYRLIE